MFAIWAENAGNDVYIYINKDYAVEVFCVCFVKTCFHQSK